ncbi:MAG: class I SAM-dependent methyltransferase, partial [Gammaproteobacteria bacterium]
MKQFDRSAGGSAKDNAESRLPHAVLDLASRRLKGLKIERLLDLPSRPQPLRILEVGTGSGGIAHYFGTHPQLHCEVDAVDVHDNRLITEGYRYQQVTDTRLPFIDESFDVVLSNHVIEHVGGEQAQRAHLAELHRVLRPEGIGYLAVPNRWMLVEPHYKLAFLSWL